MVLAKEIWTIGHSIHPLDEFLELLQAHKIRNLVDIRSYPGSRRYPHFNKAALQDSLQDVHINYFHLPELGGRRKAKPDSSNTAWRNEAFRGYADYMETEDFKNGIDKLEQIAQQDTTAYMCSEALWWRCHRSLVSDFLKIRGWKVLHIMSPKKAGEHPFTKAANIVNGELYYN